MLYEIEEAQYCGTAPVKPKAVRRSAVSATVTQPPCEVSEIGMVALEASQPGEEEISAIGEFVQQSCAEAISKAEGGTDHFANIPQCSDRSPMLSE